MKSRKRKLGKAEGIGGGRWGGEDGGDHRGGGGEDEAEKERPGAGTHPHPAHVGQISLVPHGVLDHLMEQEAERHQPPQEAKLFSLYCSTSTDTKYLYFTCVCICVFLCAECVCDAYIGVSISQQLVEDVAELPAENGVAGQRQPVDGGPEGVSALLMMGAQDAGWGRAGVKEAKLGRSDSIRRQRQI